MEDLHAHKLSDIINCMFSPAVISEAGIWSDFFCFWNTAAGDVLAAHSKPVDVRNGMVIVEADHPGRIALLQLRQNTLLKALQKKFPELKLRGIMFRIAQDSSLPGSGCLNTVHGQSTQDLPESSPHDEASHNGSMQTVLNTVKDETFKKRLETLGKALLLNQDKK